MKDKVQYIYSYIQTLGNTKLLKSIEIVIYTGWPKKVSHYRESSLNHIKSRQLG